MAIRLNCPKCQKTYTLPSESRGQEIRCECGKVFQAGTAPSKSEKIDKSTSSGIRSKSSLKKPVQQDEPAPRDSIIDTERGRRRGGSRKWIIGIAVVLVLFVLGAGAAVGVLIATGKLTALASNSSSSSSSSSPTPSASSSEYQTTGSDSRSQGSSSSSGSPAGSSAVPSSSQSLFSSGPAKPAITQDKFNKIDKGMTRDVLVSLLGEPTETKEESMLKWKSDNGFVVVVFLGEGKVQTKLNEQGWTVAYPSEAPIPLLKAGSLTQDKFNKIDKGMTAPELVALLGPPTESKKLPAPATETQSLWKSEDNLQFLVMLNAEGKVISKAGPKDWPVTYPKDVPAKPQPWQTITTKGTIGCVTMSGDDKFMATGDADGGIQIWDRATFKETRSYGGPDAKVYMMALSQDGKVLVTDAKEKTELRTWTIAKDKPETPFAPGLNPITLSYMPGGLVAVASRKMVGVGKPPEFNLLAYEPLKKQLSHSVRIDAGEENAARCLACSSDGRSVSVGCTSKQFHSYDVIQQRVIFNITGYTGAVTALAYGADGKTVVTGSEDKIVVLWEMVAPKPKQGPVFLGHTNSVTCVAISPDGKYAASGATGNAGDKLPVKVWDIANNKEFASVEAHEGTFLGLYFSADSKVLITVGDKTIKFWDVDALPALKQLK